MINGLRLTSNTNNTQQVAHVSLVGAGPGDPELITVRAMRLLQQAQVLLYDFLVSSEIVDMVPKSCERICVGKRASQHTMSQAEIQELLIQKARQGLRVVRLKGGDPMLFARGGEEAMALVQAGINCEIVPGITAALGAAASTGIALTHRDHAQMVSFVTGHSKTDSELNWLPYVNPNGTLVVYMGLKNSMRIAKALIEQGYNPHTPLAIIASATTVQQQTVISTLQRIADGTEEIRLQSPALVIIGKVVTADCAIVTTPRS